MVSYPPMLGFDGVDLDGDCNLAVAWRDRTVIATIPAGILGPMDREWLAEHKAREAAREAKEAYEQELRTLHENVYLLDDYRGRKKDEFRDTL